MLRKKKTSPTIVALVVVKRVSRVHHPAYSKGEEMKKKIVWLTVTSYHTSKVNTRSRFSKSRGTKMLTIRRNSITVFLSMFKLATNYIL